MRSLVALVACGAASATLEIFTQRFSADPAPLVVGDRVYMYTSHDTNTQVGWDMVDYNCFSSDDLVNWRDEGIVFNIQNQSWGMYAWAQQVIYNPHTQLYTMFYPGMSQRAPPANNGTGTGVATSASPTGPFNDALGHPILPCGDDPTVFIDDDGTIVLCGNCGGPLCGVLDDDMLSFKAPPQLLAPALPIWFEAPWLYKVSGTYFLSYMCQGGPQSVPPQMAFNYSHGGWDICYGTATAGPLGPYEFRGSLQWSPPFDCGPVGGNCSAMGADGQWGDNNHQGMFEFPAGSGRHWLAYHTRKLARERGEYHGYQRNVALDRLYFLSNATTRPLPGGLPWVAPAAPDSPPGALPVTATPSWVRQVKYLDPYAQQLAVTAAGMAPGLDSEPSSDGGLCLGFTYNGSWTRLEGVDFGAVPPTALTLRYATPLNGSVVSVVLDGAAPSGAGGAVIATCPLPSTGDWQAWQTVACGVTGAPTGVHTLRFLHTGAAPTGGLLNLRWWRFSGGVASGAPPPPASARVTVQSSATGLYWATPTPGAALVFANATAADAGVFTAVDGEDGTYSLSAAPGAVLCVTGAGGSGPLAATSASAADPCTRFWLYGTTAGQLVAPTGDEGAPAYALLSAASGQLLVATAAGAPLTAAAGVVDPRNATDDGARFFVATLL